MPITALLQQTAAYFTPAAQELGPFDACRQWLQAGEPLRALECLEQLLLEAGEQPEIYAIRNGLRTACEHLGMQEKEQYYRQLITAELLRAAKPFAPVSPDVECSLHFLSWFDNGRLNPVASGYRAQFKYEAASDWGVHIQLIDAAVCFPGETHRAYCSFYVQHTHRLQVGQSIVLREGSVVVATGTVLQVLAKDGQV